ncbi:peptidylprolyl isomerase [archaeon]|nr:peptidylprolyl isomerase [archaeon]|tara:strand:+ start:1196 stop:1834 length:639 start_codon:yes stop_codon:yes gene_type:complete
MKTKKLDFIEIDYTGKIKETDKIFDLTSEKEAKNNNVFQENHEYKPVIICLGKQDLIKGLDDFLIGKETNNDYTIEISSENGFGNKKQELIKLVPTTIFKKENIQPFPGLQVNLNGMVATIKTVSGGRTLVDFNHPLSGKDLIYNVKINKIITDLKEKVESILKQITKDFKLEIKEKEVIIEANIDPKIEKEIKDRIPELTKVTIKNSKTKQ